MKKEALTGVNGTLYLNETWSRIPTTNRILLMGLLIKRKNPEDRLWSLLHYRANHWRIRPPLEYFIPVAQDSTRQEAHFPELPRLER